MGLTTTTSSGRKGGFTSNPTSTLATMGQRYRSPSPNHSISPHYISTSRLAAANSPNPRRRSWQSTRDRKTQKELEKECDEEDGDDVPDECLLENVPISPRPPQERAMSLPSSPDRMEKREKVRTAGNGTSPVPVEQGSLKPPRSLAKSMPPRGMSMGEFPIHHDSFTMKTRAKSWTAALSDLSEEAKALTEALELHADEQKHNPNQRRSRSSTRRPSHERLRVRSLAELPPLRRTNIMIDPLPISKEKEAVLSRTRPSWLPPKNPSEEKRHLREYQRMMESALEAERKKEVQTHQRMACRDDTASSLLRIWEEHVLPNWDAVTSMKRTRELWWRGIAPRSRGAVWQRAVGNELELTDASYHAALSRAKALERKLAKGESTREERRKGEWFAAIRRDVSTTYPELRIFRPGGPLCEPLVDVLMAYAMYRSDVGYVSGTNVSHRLSVYNTATNSTRQ
jgi:Rab-GTPase-TBC domain